MLDPAEPRDDDSVSHKDPNGSVVIQVSASHLFLSHTYKVHSGISLCSESLKSDLVPLLSAFLCLHRRSSEERTGEGAAQGWGISGDLQAVTLLLSQRLNKLGLDNNHRSLGSISGLGSRL